MRAPDAPGGRGGASGAVPAVPLLNRWRRRVLLARCRARGAAPRVPVVLLPGILGSRLATAGVRRLLWGDLASLYAPPRGARDLGPDPVDDAAWGAVRADGILEGIPIVPGLWEVPVYRDLVDALVGPGGYALDSPGGEPGTLFPFAYDFRRDLVELARELGAFVDRVRSRTGAAQVVLLGHSHGGLIATWLARFSAAAVAGPLVPEGREGASGARSDPRIRAVVALNVAFRGALDNLKMMVAGYRPAPLGFRFGPDLCLLARAPVETLPAPGTGCFADAGGRPLAIDVYDAEQWTRHGLGVFSTKARRALRARLARAGARDPARACEREIARLSGWLAESLARAGRVHRALSGPLPPGTAPHRVIGARNLPTLARAVLVHDGRDARCLFPDLPAAVRLAGRERARALFEPGDGEAAASSQEAWRGPGAGPVTWIDGTHRHIIPAPAAWDAVLDALALSEAGEGARPAADPAAPAAPLAVAAAG
jgi:pimeloyl-ACP methyl ester carboxylesterase